jgi:hypothetical protein
MMTSSWDMMKEPEKNVHLTGKLIKAFLVNNGAINGAYQTQLEEIESGFKVKFEHK